MRPRVGGARVRALLLCFARRVAPLGTRHPRSARRAADAERTTHLEPLGWPGGVLGIGEKFFPVPWSLLDYNKDKGGYVVPVAQDVLSKAPAYSLDDLTKNDGEFGKIRENSYTYFNVKRDW